MHDKRIRLQLDADTYELHAYFAKLRGLSTSSHLGKILAQYATSAETEFPPLRAHMLAWRAARSVESAIDRRSDNLVAIDLDSVPF